jgi:hypothetical protein
MRCENEGDGVWTLCAKHEGAVVKGWARHSLVLCMARVTLAVGMSSTRTRKTGQADV